MTTLLEARTDLRAHLNETTTRFWTDAQLTTWINEALRDVARRTETIQTFSTSIAAVAGTAEYVIPADVLRIHRIEFVPTGQTQIYPLQLATYNEMDQFWGVTPNQQQGYPSYAVLWGFPPTVKLRLWPIPSQAGTVNVFYFRLPASVSADGDTIEVLAGYQDLIVLYAEYVARRKDRDPTWQDAKQIYEEKIVEMVETTRQWHDQAMTVSVGSSAVPRWLYDGNWGNY